MAKFIWLALTEAEAEALAVYLDHSAASTDAPRWTQEMGTVYRRLDAERAR